MAIKISKEDLKIILDNYESFVECTKNIDLNISCPFCKYFEKRKCTESINFNNTYLHGYWNNVRVNRSENLILTFEEIKKLYNLKKL
jgi:hypothetical protein